MSANKADMDRLFEKRSAMEQAFLDRYLASAEDYQRQLEELRIADAEDFNVLKIRWAEHGCTDGHHNLAINYRQGWARLVNKRYKAVNTLKTKVELASGHSFVCAATDCMIGQGNRNTLCSSALCRSL